jgi:hydroxymethylpyrimidine pyrophosphatase-like HAD family hydrolase
MVAAAGYSMAMSNARARTAARHAMSNSDEDGVGAFFERVQGLL